MAVDGGAEHVVLEGGDTLPRVEGAEEGRGVSVGQLPVLELGRVVVLARFLQRQENNHI